MATVLTEGRHPGEAIMSEAEFNRSRSNVTVAASQNIQPNALLGKKAVAAKVTVSSTYTGTGNGALTLANPAVSSKVKDGVYSAVCVTAAANSGTFRVEDPNGKTIGNATVGTLFDKELKFTIADGATDFAVGDTFLITVAADAEDYQFVNFDPTATDGSETPVAYSIYGVLTGASETKATAVIDMDAVLNGNLIAWPNGISAPQRADAEQALLSRGIKVRN